MKKFILKSVSIILAISLLSAQNFNISAANKTSPVEFDESVFSFHEELLNAELSELDDLDAFVESNTNVTFSTLEEEASLLIANIESQATPMGMPDGAGEPPLGIPSFLWGCVFGVLGLLLVYIATDNNKEEAKKAMWGCLAGTAVSVIIYVVAIAAVESSSN